MTWWLTDHISAEHYNNVTSAEKQVLKFYIIACQGRKVEGQRVRLHQLPVNQAQGSGSNARSNLRLRLRLR